MEWAECRLQNGKKVNWSLVLSRAKFINRTRQESLQRRKPKVGSQKSFNRKKKFAELEYMILFVVEMGSFQSS